MTRARSAAAPIAGICQESTMPLTLLRLITCAVLATVLGFAGAAHAAWPERQVTLVVPFAAGGITDVLARAIAERLQNTLKQPFIVENQPGAAGVVAAGRVVKWPPDCYTLLF